ncbi:CRISPR-associated helicase Cas3 [hydrothermal vent metagenome]|uniref:CRISPR-associated helicase Cas3 n=1 Tax=hydrothermal vent metagenome TaxID=652676 RepID=A0A3B0WLX1_9ZZZZ
MMVTFVSQCEKKALNRTRRVLDSFANRIGDNTWQTVITNEGLNAVKKLLRKTASKSTAVSCFWIRSRSRSELVWVVGNRGKFNSEGVVPVNRTEKEVPMDISSDKPIKGCAYANTKLQRLEQHLFAVGFVARQLYLRFYPEKTKQANAVFIAGCLHDIGKIDPSFQDWVIKDKSKSYIPEDGQHIDGLKKFSFEKHPRHNEISVLLYKLLDNVSLKALGQCKKIVRHAIYWHHAKPFRPKGGFETLDDIYKKINSVSKGDAWSLVVLKSVEILNKVCDIDKTYAGSSESFLSGCYIKEPDIDVVDYLESNLPKYKTYESKEQLSDYSGDVSVNATNNEIRACLITADRWVSSMSAHELASAVKHKTLTDFIKEKLESNQIITESNLVSHIAECIKSFPDSEQTQKQENVAKQLAENIKDVGVLAGAAGCGKTKIALEWAQLRNAQQIIWICPRVQICQGLFIELRNSDQPYLPNTTVELYTGEFKCTNTYENITPEKDYFTGDMVITTIDQMLSSVISHTKADRLLNYLSAHVVFDEFHEYINMPGFNLLFAELIESKKEIKNGGDALLVSATPHYSYLDNILKLDKNYDVVEMPAFNKSRYQFDFLTYDENQYDNNNPLYKPQKTTTFVISNTATTAQKSFIKNQQDENAILLHSKYKKSDKQQLFNSVFETFKRDGDGRFDILRSGPIVQASLNISCEYMISEITHAENCLQRLGRLDRFGLNNTGVNKYTIVVPDTLHQGKGAGALARFLSRNNALSSTKAWYEFLRDSTDDGTKVLTLVDVYHIYKLFYENTSAIKLIESDLLAAMKKSAGLISAKIAEPQTIVKPKKDNKQRAKISKNSLRGDSRFVQMAVCDVSVPNNPVIRDEYAYQIPSSETDSVDNLTDSLDHLRNTGLLDYVAQKHGRMEEAHPVSKIPANKMPIRKTLLESYAKDAEYPIYLSYAPIDLDQKLGENIAHNEAIYYAVCDKQPVGAISIKQLNNQED